MIRLNYKQLVLFPIFVFSLLPLVIPTAGSGISVGYFYVLVFFLPFVKFQVSTAGFLLVSIYSLVFLAGIPDFIRNDLFYFLRTLASYLVFMIPILFVFVKTDELYFKIFKRAVIWTSVAYSLYSIFELVKIGYSGDFFLAKELIGSQRYGFVLIFAFFIALFEEGLAKYLKLAILLFIVIGLILTFSRSSFLAFGLTIVIAVMMNITKIRVTHFVYGTAFCLILILVFHDTIIGQIVEFFTSYLTSVDKFDLNNRASSEGYRLYVFSQIIDYVMAHPLFGSNFAGLYLLFDEYTSGASAHGQFNDVLLRTGLVGFTVYLAILSKMTLFYHRQSKGIFYGLVGIIIYGFFHETFKLSHGSLLFAVSLSHYLYLKRVSLTYSPYERQI